VNHAGRPPTWSESTLEVLTPLYDVIVFKHCFPVSNIGPDTGSPDVASEAKTLENYELQYAALKAKLRSFPANRFIVWTGAAKLAATTTPEMAARAQQFFTWVRTVWDEPGDNIYVWDFFNLETGGGNVPAPRARGLGQRRPSEQRVRRGSGAPVRPARGGRDRGPGRLARRPGEAGGAGLGAARASARPGPRRSAGRRGPVPGPRSAGGRSGHHADPKGSLTPQGVGSGLRRQRTPRRSFC
jgi:hypothetical protein